MKKHTRYLCHAAIIAAMYVALTYLASAFGLANGDIQLRFSEALCILPLFTPAAIPGLFIGCLVANLLTFPFWANLVFGSLATLIGAIGTRLLQKYKYLSILPPILANAIIVPFVIAASVETPLSIPYLVLTVGAGELISVAGLGIPLMLALEKRKNLFK